MKDTTKTSSNGIAIVLTEDGILSSVIHDSFGLFPKEAGSNYSFTHCLKESNKQKGNQYIESIKNNGLAYNRELEIVKDDFSVLLNFSGVKVGDNILLIGTPAHDDFEQLLDGLREMNNEQVNKLRLFLKQHQEDFSKKEEWALYDEMSELNNELANIQRKLTKRTTELEHTNELKNQMLGMAAHDLRNPLTLIQNYALFLIEDHEKENIFTHEQYQLVKQIKESSEYMVQIIESMLDISTFESGSINLDRERHDLVSLLEHAVELSRISANKKKVTLITELPNGPVNKEIDPHKFQQVLDNLLSNAIKYSHSDTEVTVGIDKANEGGGITIYVKDQGQGIPEGEMDKLFQPFSKISVEATAGEKSTGLGLAIVNKIVEAHGGSIEVKSEVGVGSTFFIILP